MANSSGKTPTPNENRRGALTIPNRFQVYLHDKPAKRPFSYDRRAFSQSYMCVRDPTKFGEFMLLLAMNGSTPNSRQLYSMFGPSATSSWSGSGWCIWPIRPPSLMIPAS